VTTEMETDVFPDLMSFAEMFMVLGAGIDEVFDPDNLDPNYLMDPSNLPFEETASVEGYTVTLTMDIRTGVMLSMLLDPDIQDQWQDPNYWYTFINQDFLDEIMDPNEQAELKDPNLFAGLDPNIFAEMGLDPNILSYLEDPNIDLFYFEAGYSIMQGYYSRGSGTLKISLDRNNGRIDLFKVNGSLGSASLTDFGISLWQDPADPNITGAALHFGKFQTPNIMADANFVMTVMGGPFAGDMIGESNSIGVNTLSIMGAFQVTNSFSWLGEIRFGDPVLVDPNFELWSLYMPSKVQLDGAYELPSGVMSFEGTITAEIFNMGELYAYEELGEGGPVDPNMCITFLGTMSVAGESDMQFSMTLSSAMEGYYSITDLQFQYGGITMTGTASIVNIPASESITLDLENQDGLDLHLVAAYTESVGDSLEGSIKKDGILIAYFEIVSNVPRVVYYNGDFETLF
jgi:hypothetical protein